MYLISKSKTNSSYQISEYQWFNISKHVLMCFYYLWIRKIKMHWRLEKIFSCLCLCLRCMLKQNSNWDGDPFPSHSHPKKEKTLLNYLLCCKKNRSDCWVKLKRSRTQLNSLFYSWSILWLPYTVTV